MLKFVGRERELSFLEGKFKSKSAELIVVYGRRRIGKTELLLRFGRDKGMLYFLGRLESREDTLRRFNNLLVGSFNDAALLNNPLRNWDNIFEYLAERCGKRILLAIDEFPFIVDKFPEILSVLQDKWDNKLKDSKIMLVLSGSSIGMMEKYALDQKSPLYGRRTGQWKVEPLEARNLRDFFPEYSIEEIVRLYACIDAIPGYLAKFDPGKSVYDNLKEKIFSKGEFLYEEVEILLREEFRDPSNYVSIISSIAGGLTAFNEVYTKTGLDKSMLSKYLYTLESLGIVQKNIPVTETGKAILRSKGAKYSLKDNFFDFWLKFVYLNKQELEKGNAERIVAESRKQIEEFVSRKFEIFIAEALPLLGFGDFNRAGNWWFKDKEIDVVALNEKKSEIFFGECKWRENVNGLEVAWELNEKTKFVDWNKGKRKEILAVFAKSFSKKINELDGKKVHCIDLEELGKAI